MFDGLSNESWKAGLQTASMDVDRYLLMQDGPVQWRWLMWTDGFVVGVVCRKQGGKAEGNANAGEKRAEPEIIATTPRAISTIGTGLGEGWWGGCPGRAPTL